MFMWFRSITVRLSLITQEKVLKALNFGLVQEYTYAVFSDATIWLLNYTPSLQKFQLIICIKDNLRVGMLAREYCTASYRITNNWSLSSVPKIIRAGLFESRLTLTQG